MRTTTRMVLAMAIAIGLLALWCSERGNTSGPAVTDSLERPTVSGSAWRDSDSTLRIAVDSPTQARGANADVERISVRVSTAERLPIASAQLFARDSERWFELGVTDSDGLWSGETRDGIRSIAARAPAKASPRWGAETAMITLGSPRGTGPVRCSAAAASSP